MQFIDEAIIHVKAGDGGNGSAAFRREDGVPRGGPSGGDGGDGGSVIIVADSHLASLLDFKYKRSYKADRGEDGVPHLRVFAVAFDSRLVFSYDPEARRIDAVIRTGRGPHAIAFDTGVDAVRGEPYSFMYVGHFTDSYVGVVDLDLRRPNTFGSMFISLGQPTPPRESN